MKQKTGLAGIALLLALMFIFNSCASILNTKHQKVTIITQKENEVKIDGEKPKMKNNKYLIKRDKKPKEITISRKGYKDENFVIMQCRKSPLFFFSVIPFGVLFYPPFYDVGKKAYNYDKEINAKSRMLVTPKKEKNYKFIKLNKVAVDIKPEDFKYRYFTTYRQFKKQKDTRESIPFKDKIEVKLENTIFTELLNDILKEKGYIDTTNRVLKSSFLNNMLIDASLTDVTFHHVVNYIGYGLNGTMAYVDITMKWEALDYYQNSVYSQTTKTTSGQFIINDSENDIFLTATKDAIEYGLIEFMNTEKVATLLKDNSQKELEKSYKEITIPVSDQYVTNLAQSVEASLTIKNQKGHGSGFFISNEGHIITNYHVVKDTANLKAILNNESEYDVEVLRTSKIHDLALLKINTKNTIPFKISASKKIQIASDIYAIGTPSGEDLSQTVSKGIISGIRKIHGDSKLIQTDASINHGNSGGAIINKEGTVIGVVSSKLNGYGIEGVAFGIPAYEIADKLKIRVN